MEIKDLTLPHGKGSSSQLKCGARTRGGTPCAKSPTQGKKRCRLHGGLSTGPVSAAGRGRISDANTKHGRFKGRRKQLEIDRFYRLRVKEILEQAREAGLIR